MFIIIDCLLLLMLPCLFINYLWINVIIFTYHFIFFNQFLEMSSIHGDLTVEVIIDDISMMRIANLDHLLLWRLLFLYFFILLVFDVDLENIENTILLIWTQFWALGLLRQHRSATALFWSKTWLQFISFHTSWIQFHRLVEYHLKKISIFEFLGFFNLIDFLLF